MNKEMIGKILYWISISMLLVYVPVILLSPSDQRAPLSRSTEIVSSVYIAVAVEIHIVSCILTGEAGARVIAVKREESPSSFIFMLVIYFLLAAVILIKGLINGLM